MAKVIVERPRFGSRLPSRKKGYRKYLQRAGLENLPRREPMLGRWNGRQRHLNEHLSPMERFLWSCVGRPWNKVHQELCEHVSFDNSVQKHVLTHVFDYVQRHVQIRGCQVIARDGWRRGRQLEPGVMYVCPVSGLLKVVRFREIAQPRCPFGLGNRMQYHWRDGAWWELRLRRVEPRAQCRHRHGPPRTGSGSDLVWDAWLEQFVSSSAEDEFKTAYGGRLVPMSKRQLTASETAVLLRRLRNRARR